MPDAVFVKSREAASWALREYPPDRSYQALTSREWQLHYRFSVHQHRYTSDLLHRLITKSLEGLQDADTATSGGTPEAPRPELYDDSFFRAYQPSQLAEPGPIHELEFAQERAAYSIYNWELFFFAPLTIAIHLSANGHFEQAHRWFHYVFHPMSAGEGIARERCWKFKPFQHAPVRSIEEILIDLARGKDTELRRETLGSIKAWMENPIQPHVIARFRPTAYMLKTVMAYLDHLIAWGDSLFCEDTGESINEAMQIYVLASNILGRRPQAVPKRGSVRPQTYATLRPHLDEFSNALVELENEMPFDDAPLPTREADTNRIGALESVGRALHFCIPPDEKLLDYWNIIYDRLFKIRNSLNIQGVFRRLPLFEPPIDPALLIRAAAAGLDVAAVVSGANQPLPLVRFQFLIQRAAEICQEVKSLGSNLLAAMEKGDAETLAILRSRHESKLLEAGETVKYSQWQEAIKARDALEESLANAAQRYVYYERLLGKPESEIQIPKLDDLDREGLEKRKFKASEPRIPAREIEVDIAQGAEAATGGRKLSSHEFAEMIMLEVARGAQDAAAGLDTTASGLSLIPQFDAHGTPIGVGVATDFGGVQLSKMLSTMAMATRAVADRISYEAGKMAKIGAYARREQEWALQSNLAAGEIGQILKQLRAAQIRQAIAEKEWKNHQQQIRQAEEIEYFLAGQLEDGRPDRGWKKKATNEGLYSCMKREVRALYNQCFQLALDVTKKAERALQHELGDPGLSFLQFAYQAGNEGLLLGEKLHFDIKRMEMAYHELNQREYEIPRHVSLLQTNPIALMQLRSTGACEFEVTESMLDAEAFGYYFRRIKKVGLSIPCVAGPYTSVNCKLTLLKSQIRTSPSLDGEYDRQGDEDPRFSDHFGSLEAVVISTSQNDDGVSGERDERRLPFERSGAVSTWRLELPADPSKDDVIQFDYGTIADVIVYLRYTAREGGSALKQAAMESLKKVIADGSVRLFSVRQEFPTAWAKFKSVQIDGKDVVSAPLTIELGEKHFPFWSQGRFDVVKRAEIFARSSKKKVEKFEVKEATKEESTKLTEKLGRLWRGQLAAPPVIPKGSPFSVQFDLQFTDNSLDDFWLALTCGRAKPG